MDIYDKLDKAMNHVNELWISIRDDPRYPDLDPIKVDAMLHWILTARDYTAELRRECGPNKTLDQIEAVLKIFELELER